MTKKWVPIALKIRIDIPSNKSSSKVKDYLESDRNSFVANIQQNISLKLR